MKQLLVHKNLRFNLRLRFKINHQSLLKTIMYAPFKAARGLICFRNF